MYDIRMAPTLVSSRFSPTVERGLELKRVEVCFFVRGDWLHTQRSTFATRGEHSLEGELERREYILAPDTVGGGRGGGGGAVNYPEARGSVCFCHI